MKPALPENPRILVTRTDRIGDLVVSTPVFKALRERYPHAHLAVCIFSEHRELIENNPYLNEVILYDKSGSEKSWLGQLCFAKKIAKKKFDCVIHLHATNRMHGMSWLARIPTRVGYSRRAAWTLTNVLAYDKKEGLKHESEYLFDLLALFEISKPAAIWPRIIVSEKSRLSLNNLLEYEGLGKDVRIAVIHPSASDVTKKWSSEKFGQFLKTWDQAGGYRWAVVGAADSVEQAKRIQDLSGRETIDFCGKLSLGMLAALFEKAELVVSNDSGPVHIAAAVGAPTVSIFGRWQPGLNAERWRPLGEKNAVVVPDISAIPANQRKFTYIEEITVEQVIHACESLLAVCGKWETGDDKKKEDTEKRETVSFPVARATIPAVKACFKRVLVVQPYGLGDMLFVTPVLRALRLMPGMQRVDMLIGSRTREMIAANPHVDEIHVIDKDQIHRNSRSENAALFKKIVGELKKNNYDLLLDYSIRGEYAFWSQFLLRIPKRAGYAYKNRAFFHNIRMPIPNGFEGKHVMDFACDLAEQAGVSVQDRFMEFFFSDGVRQNLEKDLSPRLPKNYFALSLGGGESWGKDAHLKRWAPEKYAELSKYLLNKTKGQKIVLVGSAGEKELAAQFLKAGVPAEDWVGKLSITETAWVLKQACFFLGNDGGLLHLARAVFKPVIGIYGPADPLVYGPYPVPTLTSADGPRLTSEVGVASSVVVYKPPVDGKPRYFKFRYDPNDCSLQDLSVADAIRQIEDSKIVRRS